MKNYTREEKDQLLEEFKNSNETIGKFANKVGRSKSWLCYWVNKRRKKSELSNTSFIKLDVENRAIITEELIRVKKDDITIELPMSVSANYIKAFVVW